MDWIWVFVCNLFWNGMLKIQQPPERPAWARRTASRTYPEQQLLFSGFGSSRYPSRCSLSTWRIKLEEQPRAGNSVLFMKERIALSHLSHPYGCTGLTLPSVSQERAHTNKFLKPQCSSPVADLAS